jgi:hypothetical protein
MNQALYAHMNNKRKMKKKKKNKGGTTKKKKNMNMVDVLSYKKEYRICKPDKVTTRGGLR